MKIICFIDSLGSGGAQRQLTSLAVLLKKANYDVHVVVYYNKPFYQDFLKENDVSYSILPNSVKPLGRILNFYKFFKYENPDWVIAYQDTPSIVACVCKLLGCNYKLIVSERNTTQRVNIRTRIKFNLYRCSDFVVPNSYSQGKFIKKVFGFLSNKVRVITNFVDTEYFCYNKKGINNPLEIISVARLYPQKNAPRFVEAVKLAVDRGARLHVSWFGAKGPDYNKTQSLIRKYDLDDYFELKEPTKEIVAKYHKSDFFVLPSLFEGFPNVLCEAMSCGLPVLFSDVCDNSSIAKDGYNGFTFNPLDVKQMAQVLIKISSLPENEIQQMGLRSREIIEHAFSKEDFIHRYLELF